LLCIRGAGPRDDATVTYSVGAAERRTRLLNERWAHVVGLRGLALLLAAISFALTNAIELRLFDLRVFQQWDVWFQADPNTYLAAFTEPPFWFNYRHPTLPLLTYPPLAFLGGILASFGLADASVDAARLQLALLVVPAVNALRTLILFSLFHKLLRQLLPAVLLCLLDIVAFATVTTGSVPESFPLSAACIAAMYWLAFDEHPRPGWVRPALWVVTGTLAVGTTLSNVFPLFVLLAASIVRRGRLAVRDVLTLVAVLSGPLVATGILAVAGATAYGFPLQPQQGVNERAFYHLPNAAAAIELAWAVTHTFIAPPPGLEPTWADPTLNPDFDFMFSYAPRYQHGSASLWRAGLTVGMLLTGAAGFARRRATAAWLLAPAAILALNCAMHLFYGSHYLLYALHWETSLLFVLAGIAFLPHRVRTAATAALLGFTAIAALNSWLVLEWLFGRLEAAVALCC
jgi:hypothetical protein